MGGNTTVQAPAPVNPAQIGADTLRTQLDLAPQVFAANQQYLPQYADLAQQVASGLQPALLNQQATANTSQRTSDIGDVRTLAPAAVDAWRAANPQLVGAQDQLAGRIAAGSPAIGDYRTGPAPTATSGLIPRLEGDAAGAMGSISPLQLQLQRQAMEQLGGDLSPAQIAQVQQDTRGAYAARGLYDSNQAIGAEILNTDAARAQRRAAAQQFAGQVDAAGQQQITANRNYATNVAGVGLGANQFNAQLGQQAGQFNAQLGLQQNQLLQGRNQQDISNYFNLANQYASTSQDPYQLVLGRSGTPAAAAGLAAGAGPTMFNPFDPAITQIYAGNTANQLAASTASANNAGAQNGAMYGAGGAIIGAALIAF